MSWLKQINKRMNKRTNKKNEQKDEQKDEQKKWMDYTNRQITKPANKQTSYYASLWTGNQKQTNTNEKKEETNEEKMSKKIRKREKAKQV